MIIIIMIIIVNGENMKLTGCSFLDGRLTHIHEPLDTTCHFTMFLLLMHPFIYAHASPYAYAKG